MYFFPGLLQSFHRNNSFTVAVTPDVIPDQHYSFLSQPGIAVPENHFSSISSSLSSSTDSSSRFKSPVERWRRSVAGSASQAVHYHRVDQPLASPVYAYVLTPQLKPEMSAINENSRSDSVDGPVATAENRSDDPDETPRSSSPAAVADIDSIGLARRDSLERAVNNASGYYHQRLDRKAAAPSIQLLFNEGPVGFAKVFWPWLISWPIDGERSRLLTRILLCVLAWSSVATIVGKEGGIGGHLFALSIIVIFAALGGYIARILHLPPLLGMLLMGFALRNIPGISVGQDLKSSWSSALRSFALVVILLRAGLGLDPGVLRRAKFVILRLAFLPCLFEASVDAILARLILDMPWAWGFVLG